jgi:pimeloyl-ACP methyl ester carboxylesterase
VRVPTVVWQGADDTDVPRHIGQHYGRTVPGARLEVFRQEGHFVFYRYAEDILTTLVRSSP